MLRLAFALALLAPGALAQPSAADSALVDRLVDGLRLDVSVEAMNAMAGSAQELAGPMPDEMSDMMGDMMSAMFQIDQAALEDAVRASVFADYRPELVRQALTFLEGPVFDRMVGALPFAPGAMGPEQMMGMIEDPGDRPLADSLLAAQYARAVVAATQPAELQRITIELMTEAMPASALGFFDQMGGLEVLADMGSSGEMADLQLSFMVPAARVALGEADPDDVRAATAFYESEAGRYVSLRAGIGSLRLQVPAMVEAMAPLFDMLAGLAKDMPALPPYPDPYGGSYEGPLVPVDVEPQLIGGLEGVQARVVYPEPARAEGVEGRVVVEFVVAEDGTVRDLEVVRSPDERLSEAALEAVRTARFKAGRDGGKAVAVRFRLPVAFRLP